MYAHLSHAGRNLGMGVKSSGTLRLLLFLRASPPWQVCATHNLFHYLLHPEHHLMEYWLLPVLSRVSGCEYMSPASHAEHLCPWQLLSKVSLLSFLTSKTVPAVVVHCLSVDADALDVCCSWESGQKGPPQEVGDPATQTYQVPCPCPSHLSVAAGQKDSSSHVQNMPVTQTRQAC